MRRSTGSPVSEPPGTMMRPEGGGGSCGSRGKGSPGSKTRLWARRPGANRLHLDHRRPHALRRVENGSVYTEFRAVPIVGQTRRQAVRPPGLDMQDATVHVLIEGPAQPDKIS